MKIGDLVRYTGTSKKVGKYGYILDIKFMTTYHQLKYKKDLKYMMCLIRFSNNESLWLKKSHFELIY